MGSHIAPGNRNTSLLGPPSLPKCQRPLEYLRLLQQLCLQELMPEESQKQFLITLSKETMTQYPKETVEMETPEDD